MSRTSVTLSKSNETVVDALMREIGLKKRQDAINVLIFLSAQKMPFLADSCAKVETYASHTCESIDSNIGIKESIPTQTRPNKEKEVKLGDGRKPKDILDVIAFFKSKKVLAPIPPKAQEFFDFYEGKGWVVGKSPIKKWGSCLTTWLKNNPDWTESKDSSKWEGKDKF